MTNGTAFLVNDIGKITKIFSIALVIGTPSAQLIRLKVLDDFILNSGVYAIPDSTSFQTYKSHLPAEAKWLLFNGYKFFDSVYFIIHLFYESVIRKAAMLIIQMAVILFICKRRVGGYIF